MVLEELPKCKAPTEYNPYMGQPIPPLDRLKIMSEDDFEDLVVEWANGYVHNNYYKVSSMAGAGDKGRDVVAYYDDKTVDIYQCKHYKNPLSPSQYWVEFGKLCYYTYKNIYSIPKKYYIVASNGVGPDLRDLIDKPESINNKLIEQWSEKCESRITKKERVVLEDEFLEYVKNFDFSIVCDIPPIKLIEQYSQTIYYKFRFGGGIKKREKPEVPKEVSKEEEKFNYMKELFIVYSDELNFNVKSYDELKSNKKYFNHCNRQREDFYIAQLLARVSRDEYLDSQPYDELKNEIYKGVIDCCEEEHSSCFKKVNETLKVARNMNIESMAFGPISPSEKVGICHDLVNNYEISWVGNYEGE